MTGELLPHFSTMSQSSTSSYKPLTNGHHRSQAAPSMDEQTYASLPSNDRNDWYYPGIGVADPDEDPLHIGVKRGNWGNKQAPGARWVRRGKKVAWGPAREDWETEDRARQRIKSLLPPSRSPSPLSLPHLRSPSPPLTAPYPPPEVHHMSYASFVLDPAVSHTFRSTLLWDLEQATASLIEGEAAMRRNLGRLWQVLSEDPDEVDGDAGRITKREEGDNEEDVMDDRERRIARAPDLTSPMHKLFLPCFGGDGTEHPVLGTPQQQQETLEKYVASLKELQDDGREYVERLVEIREGLGDLRAQRSSVWTRIRENALAELSQVAASATM